MTSAEILLVERRSRIIVTMTFGGAMLLYAPVHQFHGALAAAVGAVLFALMCFAAARLTAAIAQSVRSSSWLTVIVAHLATAIVIGRLARALVR